MGLDKVIMVFSFFILGFAYGQNYNKDVAAEIRLTKDNGNISVTGFSRNRQDQFYELRYVMSVFKTDLGGGKSTSKQSGQFVAQPYKRKLLSTTTLNMSGQTKIIVLLLIYNLDDEIVGKDRYVLQSKVKGVALVKKNKDNIQLNSVADIKVGNDDGVEMNGLVVEETLTKPGRDFYKIFNNLYDFNEINGKEVVKVKEVFALGRNTKLNIFVGERQVFEFFVKPQKDYLTKMGDYALIRVYKHFKNAKKLNNLLEQY